MRLNDSGSTVTTDLNEAKVLPEPQGPQLDTSRRRKSTDTGLMCRMECLFSSGLAQIPIYTAW